MCKGCDYATRDTSSKDALLICSESEHRTWRMEEHMKIVLCVMVGHQTPNVKRRFLALNRGRKRSISSFLFALIHHTQT